MNRPYSVWAISDSVFRIFRIIIIICEFVTQQKFIGSTKFITRSTIHIQTCTHIYHIHVFTYNETIYFIYTLNRWLDSGSRNPLLTFLINRETPKTNEFQYLCLWFKMKQFTEVKIILLWIVNLNELCICLRRNVLSFISKRQMNSASINTYDERTLFQQTHTHTHAQHILQLHH